MTRVVASRPATIALLAAAVAFAANCDDDVDRGTEPTPTGVGTATGSGTATGAGGATGVDGGTPADGWETAYVDGGVGTNCAQSPAEMEVAGVPSLTFGDTTLYVGFEQNGNNQNPVFARADGGAQIYCEHHETEGPDGRAVGLAWNGGDVAYVTYTIVGGGSSLEGKGGWLSSYAPGSISGGGPKVSYVGNVEVAFGTLQSGTFIIAVTSENKVNSHSPAAAAAMLDLGQVEFLGESAHKPIDGSGDQPMSCTDYPFSSRYRFSAGLDAFICADCTNCTSQQPCP